MKNSDGDEGFFFKDKEWWVRLCDRLPDSESEIRREGTHWNE